MNFATYIIPFRDGPDSIRRDNLAAVLHWLERFPGIEVIVVEQYRHPLWSNGAIPANVREVFAYNPGPFNKSWGFNVGARIAERPVLIFGDGDMVADEGLEAAAGWCTQRYDAVKPYGRMLDLDPDESMRVRSGDFGFIPKRPEGQLPNREGRQEFVVFAGGIFAIRRDRFFDIGGFDERFLGWGGEDDAMSHRIRRRNLVTAEIEDAAAVHLWHPRPPEATLGQPHYEINRDLLDDYAAYSDSQLLRLCEVQRQTIGYRKKYESGPKLSPANR